MKAIHQVNRLMPMTRRSHLPNGQTAQEPKLSDRVRLLPAGQLTLEVKRESSRKA